VVGLLLLVGGAASSEVWLGVLGFVVMFASVAIAFTRPRRSSGPVGVVRPDGTATRPAAAARKKGFMSRMEDRWDRRRDEGR
jgi:hypothetical protein